MCPMFKAEVVTRLFDKARFPAPRDPNIRKEIRAWRLMDVFTVTSDFYQRKDKNFLPFDYIRGAMFIDRLWTAYQHERLILARLFIPEALEHFIELSCQREDFSSKNKKEKADLVRKFAPGIFTKLHVEQRQIPESFTYGMADMLTLLDINIRMMYGE